MMKTTSSLFTAILASILLTISIIPTCTAFSVQTLQSRQCPSPSRPQPSYRVPVALFGGENDESAAASVLETADAETPVQQQQVPAVKCPDCDLCDGSGRILGGIGTVLTWWPIKAYRPCPNFIERGGRYVRSGQGLDEIAFGRDSTFQNDN
eukprot:CAMPEP_0171338440 /NCGR_PEP_ID=MMETSP0878-20121228/7327_1 /TAXON_ID=67004 /ORGANISM="Thalassiosira weissflogii, Strain CCMP1336" /LENGTH=151 /DNA_ID=CAMNT_0011840221 /DNA_START=23 /DNA_END=478 /DNA_ORIENTATION=+